MLASGSWVLDALIVAVFVVLFFVSLYWVGWPIRALDAWDGRRRSRAALLAYWRKDPDLFSVQLAEHEKRPQPHGVTSPPGTPARTA